MLAPVKTCSTPTIRPVASPGNVPQRIAINTIGTITKLMEPPCAQIENDSLSKIKPIAAKIATSIIINNRCLFIFMNLH